MAFPPVRRPFRLPQAVESPNRFQACPLPACSGLQRERGKDGTEAAAAGVGSASPGVASASVAAASAREGWGLQGSGFRVFRVEGFKTSQFRDWCLGASGFRACRVWSRGVEP